MNRNGIIHLECWSIRIFSLLGILSAFNFILWGFCPIMLLSILAFLYLPKWSHEENVICPHLYNVITWTEMGSYTLNVGVLEYFSFGDFVRFDFYPLGLFPYFALSILAFLYPPTWSHDENVDCPHLYYEITWTEMGLYTLIVGVLEYVLYWRFCPIWFASFLAFVLWCFCQFWLFSVRLRDRMTRILIVNTCIMWSHEQKWDRTPWLLEYWNIFSFGGFVRFDLYPLSFLPNGAFVHFGFSLSSHVIAWRECWLSTPVPCD